MDQRETGARERTRGAIVDAAIARLAADAAAPLSDIAAAARVSRTTVHRYFPERSGLVAAVADEAVRRVSEATRRARLDRGPAPESIARLCREYFELGDLLTVLFTGVVHVPDDAWAGCEPAPDRALSAAVARGHADGTIDAALDAAWVEDLLWALLYTGWAHARRHDVPRQESLGMCLHALGKAIGA